MPIAIPSRLDGVAPSVQTLLRELADAVNRLEPVLARPEAAAAAPTDARIVALEDTVAYLRQQIAQYTPRAEEAEETPIEGQPSLPPTPTPGDPTPGGPSLGIVGAGSAQPTVALPNLFSTVSAYAAANPAQLTNSCLDSGGSWDFMDGVVAALKAVDSRIGYNGKRGDTSDPSEDAVSYYHGILPAVDGSPDVYVIDIIGGHCGANPVPTWTNVTTRAARGAYLTARP